MCDGDVTLLVSRNLNVTSFCTSTITKFWRYRTS